MATEYEAKFLNIERGELYKRLERSGFERVKPEFLMRRTTFHFPQEAGKKWARVRDEGDRITMTIKELVKDHSIDGLIEIELIVDNFDNASDFLKCCGLSESAYQENKREIWRRGTVEACIDEWPGLNPYVEIEGLSEEDVAQASRELAFNYAEAVFGSSDVVYEKVLGIPSAEFIKIKTVTFQHPPKKAM